jgi:hypothetical protein
MTPAQLKRLERLEAVAPTGTGNWVVGGNGKLISDSWDPDQAADDGALERVMRQLDMTREHMQVQPGYVPPTEAQKAESKVRFDEMLQRMRAERQALKDFTAKVERECLAAAGESHLGVSITH